MAIMKEPFSLRQHTSLPDIFMHPFIQYLLSIYYVVDLVLNVT